MSDIFLLPFYLKYLHLSSIRLILQICKIYLYQDNKFNRSTSYTQRKTNKQTNSSSSINNNNNNNNSNNNNKKQSEKYVYPHTVTFT